MRFLFGFVLLCLASAGHGKIPSGSGALSRLAANNPLLTSFIQKNPALANLAANNPLLTPLILQPYVRVLPRFSDIKPEHIPQAIIHYGNIVDAEITALEKTTKDDFATVFTTLERLNVYRDQVPSLIEHLQTVDNHEELRAMVARIPIQHQGGTSHYRLSQLLTHIDSWIFQSKPLYEKLQKLQNDSTLSATEKRLVDLYLRGMSHSGVALTAAEQTRLATIDTELVTLRKRFDANINDAREAFKLVLKTADDIAGLPENFLQTAAQRYRENFLETETSAEQGPWLVTLEPTAYTTFMRYSDRRDLRKKVYLAHSTLTGQPSFDNRQIIQHILKLRSEYARLLGYPNFAEFILKNNVLDNVQSVDTALRKIHAATAEQTKRGLHELTAYANANGQRGELAYWDVSYWSHRLSEEKFAIDDEELRAYFPLPKVLTGMFQLAEKMFAIDIRPNNGQEIQKWHADVSFYDIFDQASGKRIAAFYLDPYSRKNKGRIDADAWVRSCVRRDATTIPVSCLITNFSPPVGDQHAQLFLNGVRTLFHEFGHALHHLLTETNYPAISGTSGVERDAVEFPSQLMEHFPYLDNVLPTISAHVDSGEPLPPEKLAKLRAKKYLAAFGRSHELFHSLLNLHLHTLDPAQPQEPITYMHELAREILPRPLPDDYFLPPSSLNIQRVDSYRYIWASALSANLFAMFREHGLDDAGLRSMGEKLRETVFAVGGGKPARDILRKLRDEAL